jgi:hypothetical protein
MRSSPTSASPTPLAHIMSGRPRGSAIAYVGPEAEMPDAAQFTACKKFVFTFEERTSMTANGTPWTDTKTFVQATTWAYETGGAGAAPESPSVGNSKVSSSTPPTTADNTQFTRKLQRYKAAIKPSKPNAIDIYLMYDYGNNMSPPHGGCPLLFDVWESDEPEKGAIFYAERHGATGVMKFRAHEDYTATEWVVYFIEGSNAYRQRHGGARPKWFSEPLKYDLKELKFDIFELAKPLGREEEDTCAGEVADPSLFSRAVWDAESVLLSTVPIPARRLIGEGVKAEEPQEAPLDQQSSATAGLVGTADGIMADNTGGSAVEPLTGGGAGGGARENLAPPETDLKAEGKKAAQEDEAPPPPAAIAVADTFASKKLCMVCYDVVEEAELYILCNGSFGEESCKHRCHTFCFPSTLEAVVPCAGLYEKAKEALQLADTQVPAEFLQNLKCVFSTMKNTMKKNSAQEAQTQKAREQELDHARAKAAINAAEAVTAEAGTKKAPVPIPPVEQEAVVLVLRGLPVNPHWKRAEQDEKLKQFRAVWKEEGIDTVDAWMGPATKGDVVPVYMVFGPTVQLDGSPNLEVIHTVNRLLATQALEARDQTSAVWTQPPRPDNTAQLGWARAGNETLFQYDEANFEPQRIIIQLERSQEVLDLATHFKTADKQPLRYVLAEKCPIQPYLRAAMPRYVAKLFSKSFDEAAANDLRTAQHERERLQRERDKDKGQREEERPVVRTRQIPLRPALGSGPPKRDRDEPDRRYNTSPRASGAAWKRAAPGGSGFSDRAGTSSYSNRATPSPAPSSKEEPRGSYFTTADEGGSGGRRHYLD